MNARPPAPKEWAWFPIALSLTTCIQCFQSDGEHAFRSRLTLAVSTDRVLAQFCHSSVAVSLTGNLPEDRHLASQNAFYSQRVQLFGPAARRGSATTAAPATGHFEKEAPPGERDTDGPAEEGKRSAEPGVFFAAVRTLWAAGEAPTSRVSPSRTAGMPIRAPGHRSSELRAPLGTGPAGSDLPRNDGGPPAIGADHLQQRR